MKSDPAPASNARSAIGAALDVEIARLELRIVHLWIALCFVGTATALAYGMLWAPALGLYGGATVLGYAAWFVFVAYRFRDGPIGPVLRRTSSVVEATVPWVSMVVLWLTRGPVYALGSWLPPMLFAALILASAARLRHWEPIVIAVTGAIFFPALYLLSMAGTLPESASFEPLFLPATQFVRAGSLLVAGLLGTLIARGLRRAIAKAERVTRERDLFGKYRLLRHIASGGMGSVYEAVYCPEGGFERPVAVKRVHPHLATEEKFVAAFREEAELSARLVHPNVVQVLDFGSIGDSYFLAMEHVDGITLRSLMMQMRKLQIPMPVDVAAHVTREILAGLEYSHRGARDAGGALLRIVHRDLCPANVLLSRHGVVKITDFGVAKVLRDAAVATTTSVAGHMGYMPPEQARAEPVDARCDIFATGVVLWEMLCGRRLFKRDSYEQTMLALMAETVPPPSEIRPEVDPRLDRVVLRATRTEPEDRYGSAAEMAAALNAVCGDAPCPDALAGLIESVVDLTERAGDDEPTQAEAPEPTVATTTAR